MLPEDILALGASVLRQEGSAVERLSEQLDESFVTAVNTLMACEGHVLVSGSGTSHAVGLRLAHLLTCCGTPALFVHPGDAQHGGSGTVTARDVVVAVSKGGETTELNHLASVAKERGAALIGLTERPVSTLGRMCDVVLRVQPAEGIDLHGMIATGSSLVNSAMGDALCAVVLRLRGYTREDFGKTHPGGAVGLQLRSLSGGEVG